MTFRKTSGRREHAVDKVSRSAGADSIDREANKLANKIARDRRDKIRRRKWAIETACLVPEEMTIVERIGLAKAIDEYVHEGEAA